MIVVPVMQESDWGWGIECRNGRLEDTEEQLQGVSVVCGSVPFRGDDCLTS